MLSGAFGQFVYNIILGAHCQFYVTVIITAQRSLVPIVQYYQIMVINNYVTSHKCMHYQVDTHRVTLDNSMLLSVVI